MLSFSPPWLICCPFLFWQASAKGTGFWFQLGCSFCLTVSTGIERVRHLHALLGICFGALAWVSQFCYLGNPATSPSLACCPCLAASGAWVQVLFLPWFKARNRWGMSYLPMLLAKLHSLVPGCLSWLEVHVPALSAYKLISLMNKLGYVIYIAFWCGKNCNLHIGYIALHKQVTAPLAVCFYGFAVKFWLEARATFPFISDASYCSQATQERCNHVSWFGAFDEGLVVHRSKWSYFRVAGSWRC